MPHKRAKHSVREQQRKERGSDLVPTSKDSIYNEPIPKSAMRVLNALKIREEFKEKKRKAQEEEGPKKKRKTEPQLKILPGESIQHFNRRVEDDLRPLVKSAMDAGRASSRRVLQEEIEERKAKREAKKTKEATPSSSNTAKQSKTAESDLYASKTLSKAPPVTQKQTAEKDFASASTSAPKRLNDIAQAPPEFKNLPRGSVKAKAAGSTLSNSKSDVVSMAQKVMMEQEREKAIKRYRELKAARLAEGGSK